MDTSLGIIGIGYWGSNLLRNFNEVAKCTVKMVCDLDPERLEKVKRNYPSVLTCTDFEEMIQRKDISAIIIATPVSWHYKMAKKALLGGKHVLVEKPMTTTVDEARDLIGIAKRQNKVLMVDHTFLYTGSVKKLREIIGNGELGEIYYIDSVRVNLGVFRSDVNVIWDLLAHDVSIINHVIDAEPMSVSAIGRSVGNSDLECMSHIALQYPNNTLAHVSVNWLFPVKVRTMVIGGSKKMVIYDDTEPLEKVKVYDRGLDHNELNYATPKYRFGDVLIPKVDTQEALFNMASHFLDCISGGDVAVTDGRFSLSVVAALEASGKSLTDNGKWVRVNSRN